MSTVDTHRPPAVQGQFELILVTVSMHAPDARIAGTPG